MSTILKFITIQPPYLIYLVLFGLIILENTVPFAPGDAILIITAYLAGWEVLHLQLAYLVTVLAALVGFVILYYVGRFWGRRLFDKKHSHLISAKKMARVDHYFHKYGYKVLAIGRFIPGTRFVLGVMAGFAHLQFSKSVFYTFVSIILWNLMIFSLGKFFGENWEAIKSFVRRYNTTVLLGLVFLITAALVFRYFFYLKRTERPIND